MIKDCMDLYGYFGHTMTCPPKEMTRGLLVHFRLESAKRNGASGMIPEPIYSICTKESLKSLGLSMLCSEMDPPFNN